MFIIFNISASVRWVHLGWYPSCHLCCVCVSGEGGHVSDTKGAEDCRVLNWGEEKMTAVSKCNTFKDKVMGGGCRGKPFNTANLICHLKRNTIQKFTNNGRKLTLLTVASREKESSPSSHTWLQMKLTWAQYMIHKYPMAQNTGKKCDKVSLLGYHFDLWSLL